MSTKNQQRRAKLQRKNGKKIDEDDVYLDQLIQEAKEERAAGANAADSNLELNSVEPNPANAVNADMPRNPNTISQGGDFAVPRQIIITKANEIWKVVKSYAFTNVEFKELKDQDRLDLFRSKFGYAQFMDEFPIVSRYMMCYGQYSSKAFERMLKKIENVVHPPPNERAKNYMEDQWVRRQADYVQYLWESYQKHHQNTAERQYIWTEAYNRLKKEFDDFRDMHKEIEERVKVEKKVLAGQNARELLERLANKQHEISPDEEEILLAQLKEVFDKKNTPDSNESEETEESDPTQSKEHKILMIETVDTERMSEIDDKYKPKELRGMEPIIESNPETSADPNIHEDEELLEEIEVE